MTDVSSATYSFGFLSLSDYLADCIPSAPVKKVLKVCKEKSEKELKKDNTYTESNRVKKNH